MKIIKAKAEILFMDDQRAIDEIYARIETAGRTCYKSENHITPESSRKFAAMVVKNHHEAMLEHASVMVRFTVDRGVSHEIVRHRIAAFAQESTRYCDYSKGKFGKEISFIEPVFWTDEEHDLKLKAWKELCQEIENMYLGFRNYQIQPQEARSILPNSLKTEVVMTANIREWRHFFRLRAACETGMPHPQMLEVSVPLFQEMSSRLPELFSDIVIPEEVLEKYGKQVPVRHNNDQCEGQITMEELLNGEV